MHVPLISIRMVVAGLVLVLLAGAGVAGGFWVVSRGHAGSPGPWAALAGVGVAAVVAWRRSWVRHPWRNCRRCTAPRAKGQQRPASGSGRHTDTTVFKGKSGRCTCCQGRGQHVRLAVRVFQPGRARELAAGKRGRYG